MNASLGMDEMLLLYRNLSKQNAQRKRSRSSCQERPIYKVVRLLSPVKAPLAIDDIPDDCNSLCKFVDHVVRWEQTVPTYSCFKLPSPAKAPGSSEVIELELRYLREEAITRE